MPRRPRIAHAYGIMDILAGLLFAALVIGAATVAGISLDRTRRRAERAAANRRTPDSGFYSDF